MSGEVDKSAPRDEPGDAHDRPPNGTGLGDENLARNERNAELERTVADEGVAVPSDEPPPTVAEPSPSSSPETVVAEDAALEEEKPLAGHSAPGDEEATVGETLIEPPSASEHGSEPPAGSAGQEAATVIEQADRDASAAPPPPNAAPDDLRPTVAETVVEPSSGPSGSPDQRTHKLGSSPTGDDVTKAAPGGAAQPSGITPIGVAGSQRYELVEPFARGGLGRIWRALDTAIRREVAYKELLPAALKNRQAVERFLEEAQITGQLEHPSIVPIYDLGFQQDGTPFYAMKFVQGKTLETAISDCHRLPPGSTERRLAFTKLLRHFIDICNAVAFAHERGVLHRDLKPQNIMVGAFGETLVLDWGLAKLVDVTESTVETHTNDISPDDGATIRQTASGAEPARSDQADLLAATVVESAADEQPGNRTDNERPAPPDPQRERPQAPETGSGVTAGRSTQAASARRLVRTNVRTEGSRTLAGSIMGTPAYMPPEQAAGRVDDLDQRSDIYSLGGILYRILTNEHPVPKGKVSEILKRVRAGDLVRPRERDASIPKPLEAICLKAMAREKASRYGSALELAADVEAWLADACYRDPWYARLRRWARRHQTLVVSTTAAAVVFVAGWILWVCVEAHRLDQLHAQAEIKALEARRVLEQGAYDQAKSLLVEALGIVQPEESLADFRQSLEDRIAAVERLRLDALRAEVEAALARATMLFREKNQPERARLVLTSLMAKLDGEQQLAASFETAQRLLAEIETVIQHRQAREAAHARFVQFQEHVDRARMHGSLFTGVGPEEDSREALKHVRAALEIFPIDSPDERPQEADWLSKEQLASLRDNMFELMLIAAESQRNLAVHDDPDRQRPALLKALEWIGRAKRFGRSAALSFLEASVLERLGRPAEAEDARRRAQKQLGSATGLDCFLLGQFERQRERYEAALRWYQKALQRTPDHFWSLNFMGLCQLKLGRPDAAVASYTAAVARRPDFSWPYVTRAVAFAELKRFEEAHRDFEKAIELEPNLYFIYLNRGAVYVIQQEYKKAVADFEKAAQLRPDLAAPHINLGETYRRQADAVRTESGLVQAIPLFQKALDELTTAARLAPDAAKIYKLRADVHHRLEASHQALRDFQQAVRLERSVRRTAEIYKQIGLIHHRAGQWSEALSAYDRALAADDSDPELHRLRGEVLLKLHRTGEAVDAFTEYLKRGEPVGDVYRARALARAQLGDYRKAMEDYTRALELEPSAHMLTRRGWAYLLRANELALADFDQAIQLNPDNPDSYTGRGYAKIMLGDYDGAIADAKQSLQRAQPLLAEQGARAWPIVYNNATIFAQAVKQVREDVRLPEGRRRELAESFLSQAIKLIRQAAKVAGREFRPQLVHTLKSDSALNPIRTEPLFRELLKELGSPSEPK
ncbi:MAG: tetratricopeptide repeat protein [Planctomycetes bacterium]|nr:tetratricopeptide repeat protein [Planctomycetota bacterium]